LWMMEEIQWVVFLRGTLVQARRPLAPSPAYDGALGET